MMKKLDKMAEDVFEGDLILIYLRASTYIGYMWKIDAEIVKDRLLNPEEKDLLFCSIDPLGNTRMKEDYAHMKDGTSKDLPIIRDKIQFVGVSLERRTLGNEEIRGYYVMSRARRRTE